MRLRYNLFRHLAGINFEFRSQLNSTANKMSKRVLLAFDFDHTIVDGNTDIVARNLIPSTDIPQTTKDLYRKGDWIDYMEKIFEHLHHQNITSDRILDSIRSIPAVSGMLSLLEYLRRPDCEVIIISDSNSVFISTWLATHQLSDLIRHVYTNPAEFDKAGQLHVTKYHIQNWCKLSSVNMCKGHVLEKHINTRKEEGVAFSDVVYVGDGQNDLCPSLRLSANDNVFVREGYSLEKAIKNESCEYGPLKAKIHMWKTGCEILNVIKNSIINDDTNGA